MNASSRFAIHVSLSAFLAACGETPADPDSGAIPDAGPRPECPRPTPIVAGTPETDALASAPARCGQPAHAWRDDPSLGDIVATNGDYPRFRASVLVDLAAAQGIVLPEAPQYDVAEAAITYVTQDRGELVEATALVAWPLGLADAASDPDVVLLLHGSSGYADGCGPTNELGGQVLAAVLASLGWIVVAPDYLGLRGDGEPTGFPHPYLVGQPTAIASLDAARAVLGMAPATRSGLCTSGRVLVLGGSQGGHAALWVDRLAPYYARELELVGTIATVPPANALAQMERALTELVDATRSSIVFFGVAPTWYGAGDRLGEVFVPALDAQITSMITTGCEPGGPISPSSLGEVFTPAILDAAARGELAGFGDFGCMAEESSLTATAIPRIGPSDPSYAILYVLAQADPLVSSPIERTSAETLCTAGVPIQFVECEGAGHIEGTTWALPEIVEFARARFAGEVPTGLCTIGAPVRCRGTPGP